MTYSFNDIDVFQDFVLAHPTSKDDLLAVTVLKMASDRARNDFLNRYGSADVRPILYNVEDSIIEFGGAE